MSSEEGESDTETFLWSALKKDEFHFDFWTDVDSDSPDSLSRHDWRLSAVRARLSTSRGDVNVKQYWTREPEKPIFEHRVLKGGKWCLIKPESDLHVYAAEIVEIEWNIEARLVHIVMRKNPIDASADGKPRGDVMASFLRRNTMRRFLFFCRERGMVLVKKDSEELNRVWRSIVSEQLPGPGHSTQLLVE